MEIKDKFLQTRVCPFDVVPAFTTERRCNITYNIPGFFSVPARVRVN